MNRHTTSAVKELRFGAPPGDEPSFSRRRYTDLAAVLLLLILTVVSQWPLLRGGTIVGIDSATQFYPWYSYLGESLRSGEVPGWNPHQFSGAPFAADPLSGWSYLPAMLLFTLLPLTMAAKVYLFIHPLLAGLFTYGLARALRLDAAGALLAAVIYEMCGYLYVRNTCCFAYAGVVVWLPLTILGAEVAIRSLSWRDRGLWWGVSGLGLSQILASWLGQGSYYALLALGGYVVYRTVFFPPENLRGVVGRISGLVMHGGAVLLFGFGLAAAGVLPRLEYNALSNLAGGYPDPISGWRLDDWESLLVMSDWNYLGAAVLALALAAPLVAGARFAVPYFAILCVGALTLAGKGHTVLHSALYLLPLFEPIHHHFPQRAMTVFQLGAAMLAGATLTGLGRWGTRARYLAVLPFLAAVFLVTRSTLIPPVKTPEDAASTGLWESQSPLLLENGISLLPGALISLFVALLFAASYALLPRRLVALRAICAVVVVLAVFADLLGSGTAAFERREATGSRDRIVKKDLEAYYAPTGATRFLQSGGEGASRYVGYDWGTAYNTGFTNPKIRALQAENRATLRDGLYGVQGYNAVKVSRYDEYVEAMNGEKQDYHGANVFAGGFDSPLFDLLNVRHVVVPADIGPNSPEILRQLEREYPTVYEGDRVKVLENRDALPRAWIVHSARRTKPDEALRLLDSGAVDGRKTALLEGRVPQLGQPEDPSRDRASITGYGADEISLKTSTGAKGLLVLSEVYYPAWKAYVDGEPVPLRRANHLFRAVPVPAGEHEVELRYESWTLRAGIAISLLFSLALCVLLLIRIRRPATDLRRSSKDREDTP